MRKYAPYYVMLAVMPLVSFLLHFRGVAVLGLDSEPPLRPDLLPWLASSAWHSSAYFGQTNPFDIAAFVPVNFTYWLLGQLHFSVQLSQKLILTALFVAPAFTAAWMYRVIRGNRTHAFICGLLYALSPILLLRLYVPVVTVQLVYAATPLIIGSWIQLLRAPDRHERSLALLRFCVIELLSASCAANPAFWIAPHFACAIVTIAAMRFVPMRRLLAGAALGACCIIAANAFWLFPFGEFAAKDAAALSNQSINAAYTEGVRKDIAETGALQYSFRLLSKAITTAADRFGPYWSYARALSISLIAALYFIPALLAAAALVRWRRSPWILVFGLLWLVALFVMKGESPPGAAVLRALYHLGPIAVIFRDGFDKFASVASLALAFLATEGLVVVAVRCGFFRTRVHVATAIALALSFPLWTGQMFQVRPKGPSLNSFPPSDAFAFFRALDNYTGRIVIFPASANPLLVNTSWGFYGPNIYGSLTKAAVVPMRVSTLNDAGTNDFSSQLFDAAENENTAAFLNYASRGGVTGVIVASDLLTGYYGGNTPTKITQFLNRISGVRKTREAGAYALYELPVPKTPVGSVRVTESIGYEVPISIAIPASSLCFKSLPLVYRAPATCEIQIPHRGRPANAEILEAVVSTWSHDHSRLHVNFADPYDNRIASREFAVRPNAQLVINGVDLAPDAPTKLVLTPGTTGEIEQFTGDVSSSTVDLSAIQLTQNVPACCVVEFSRSRSRIEFATDRTLDLPLRLSTVPGRAYVVSADTGGAVAEWAVSAIDTNGEALSSTSTNGKRLTLAFTASDKQTSIYFSVVMPPSALYARRFALSNVRVSNAHSSGKLRFDVLSVAAHDVLKHSTPATVSVQNALPNRQRIMEQNGQYDTLWRAEAISARGRVPLGHVTSDGFKNAWLLPGDVRAITIVYDLDNAQHLGVLVTVASLAVLALGALLLRRRSGATS